MRGSAKAFAVKLGSSLVVIALLAPVLALSMIAGGRVSAVTQSNGNEWLLIALAFGAAATSALNGLGRSVRRSQAARGGLRTQGNHSDSSTPAAQLR